MNRWRVVVCLIVVLALVGIVASAFFPTHPFLYGPRPFRFGEGPGLRGWSPLMGPVLGPLVRILGQVGTLLAQFVVGVIFLYLVPDNIQFMAKSVSLGTRKVLRDLAMGFVLAITLAAVAVLSALSLHTFPLPFILLGLLFVVALAGVLAIALAIGRGLLQRAGWYRQRPLLGLALGILIVSAVALIPILGDVVLGLVLLTGAGVAVATHFGTGRPWRLTPLVEDVAP